jgi:peptide deformylase
MAVLDIRVLGDPVLRERTAPVASVTDELRTLIDDMFETMYAAEGIGLAAPQVGRRERVFVADVDGTPYVFVNPEIVAREGSERGEEGCLSIPDIYGDVDRATWVRARGLDRGGAAFEIEATGLLARCIQHELDHLDGKLFIDYLSLLKRKFVLRGWEREAAKYPNFVRKLDPAGAGRGRSRRRAREEQQAAATDPTAPPFEPEL